MHGDQPAAYLAFQRAAVADSRDPLPLRALRNDAGRSPLCSSSAATAQPGAQSKAGTVSVPSGLVWSVSLLFLPLALL